VTAKEHREWLSQLSQAEINHMHDEYRRTFGESERDAAVRDTNHVLEAQSRKGTVT
jgi:hypothetical protein